MGRLPQLSRSLIWKTGLTLGLSLGIRVGGFMLIGYLGLFYLLRYLQIVQQQKAWRHSATYLPLAKRYIVQIVSIVAIAYSIMLVFWPWAQLDPFVRPLQALLRFSQFPYDIGTFFEGAYIHSNQVPWYYALKWLLITLPEFLLAGLFGGAIFVAIGRIGRRDRGDRLLALQKSLLAFSALFPIGIVVLTHAPLCNGIRHLLFAVALLAVLSAVCVGHIVSRMPRIRWAMGAVVGALLTLTSWDMVGLHPNEYVYFNRLFGGGVAQAASLYETDYYQHSYTQGIGWVKNYFEQNPPPRKVRIAGISPHMWYMFDQNQYEFVSVPWEADLYLINTYFDAHRNIPGQVLHTIQANGAELLYIIRPDSSYSNHPLFAGPPTTHRYFQLATIYEGAGQADKALAVYRKGLQDAPENAGAHSRMGDVYFKRQEYERALKSYKIAVGLKPTIAEYHAKMAMAYQNLEQYSKAIQHYTSALHLQPSYWFALHSMALIFVAVDKLEDAAELYQRIAQEFPTDAKAYTGLANVRLQQGERQEAIQLCEKALQFDPNLYVAYNQLGDIFIDIDDVERALWAYSESLQINPNDPDVHAVIGNIYLRQDKTEQVIYHYREALRIKPDYTNVSYNLGLLFFNQKQWYDAIDPMRNVIALEPERQHAWYTLARVYRQIDDANAAHETIAAAIALDPTNSDYWSEYARIGAMFQESGRADEALAIYQRILGFDPDDPVAKSGLETLLKGISTP